MNEWNLLALEISCLSWVGTNDSLLNRNKRSVETECGEGNGTPLQYSCLGNPMGRGAWWAAVHGVTKSRTQLSN